MKFCVQLILVLGLLISFSFRAHAQPILTIDTIIDATCNLSADGAINISVAGNPNFTYAWSNGATTEDVSGLFAGSYVVTVTDGLNGVTVSSVLTVGAPPVLIVNTDTIIHVSCAGDANGAVYVSVGGGVPNYTYIWDNGATTEDVTGLTEGPVNLTVTDANGCTSSSKSIFLDSIAPLTLTVDTISNISCNGANDGYINITVIGGVGNFSYLWNSGQTTDDISALGASLYTVTATDSNGCSISSGPHTITEPGLLSISLDTIIHLLCNGENSGQVLIATNGGTIPYSFSWSNGATTEDITGLLGDTYFVTVTDSIGCQATSGPHVVNEPSTILVFVDSIIHQLCSSVPSGAVDLSVSGGTPGYTYLWGNGETTQDVSGLYSGVNDVTVTDNNGCTASAKSIFLDSIAPIVITLDSIIDVSCNGANDGGVFVSVSGGRGPAYFYNWSNGATTQNITGLAGNSYTVTVTDSNSCVMVSGPHLVAEPLSMVLAFDSIQHVDCNGNANGAVFVTTTGGITSYSYNWSNGFTTEDITGLSGGSYDITVTDNNGCTVSAGPFVVNEPAVLQLTLDSIQHVDCNGNANGAILITVSGGTTNYTYNWSNGFTTQNIFGLNGGSYIVTVTDANGCAVTDTAYVVNEPTAISIVLDSILDVSCNSFGDGAVFVSSSGGTTNYTFNWSNGFTTEDVTGLSGGSFTLTLTDANGCTHTSGPHIVIEPAGMTITLDTISHVSCNAASDGLISLATSGGAPAYIFDWSNGMTTEDITGLNGGNYMLTVTDVNGCTVSTGPFVVNEPAVLQLTLDSIQHVDCNGNANGAVLITTLGGTTNYNYNWSNGMTTEDITGLNGGNYMLTVTDANGCTVTDTAFVLNEPTVLAIVLDSIGHLSCNNDSTGAVFITTSGGTTNYSYYWSNGMTTEDVSGLLGGNYTITVTDANGCTDIIGPNIVFEPSALNVVSDSIINVDCNGNANGAVYVSVSGGLTSYSFIWSNGFTTEDITGLSGASYTLIVTDSNGCTLTYGPDSVSEPEVLQIVVDTFKNESCDGITDGFVHTSVLGGTAPFGYLWNTSATTNDISGLIAGTYTITLTDSNSCMATDSITINDIPTIVVTLDAIDSVSCNGLSDGALNITTTLGAPGYSWLWSNTDTTETLSGLNAGSYTVTVTDSLGCQVIQGPFLVEQPDVLVLTLDNVDSVSCNGANDGAVAISTSGGTATYFYNWSNGMTTEDISGLNGNSYALTVTDINACTTTSGPHIVNEETAIAISLDTIIDLSCNGANDGTVAIIASGGLSSYLYNWDNSSATTSTISGLAGNTYTLTITDAAGCTATSGAHTVTEPAALSLSIMPTVPLQGCLGQAIGVLDAAALGGTDSLTYLWSNAATSASNTGLNTGVYTVTITDANGCTITAQDSIQDPLVPTVSPFVGQSPITDTTINWNDVILVDAGNDQSASGVTYQWSETTSLGDVNFDDGTSASTTVNPQPVNPGTYVLLLTATSLDGCIDTGSVTITITISELIGMPNAFTPNGDGINDYFRPAGLDDQFILEFKIYNRWSQLVFDGTDTSINWDGNYQGVDQPSEVYIYILRYKIPSQEEKIMKGEMTLMR
ncbi:MAG: gliding motility-associated C-terminal domain-containing protein [Saprospiraceae bacterium]|nr:gliding motility-associated C-terminal domain-containing protein [Saprospiraceae bacterium]